MMQLRFIDTDPTVPSSGRAFVLTIVRNSQVSVMFLPLSVEIGCLMHHWIRIEAHLRSINLLMVRCPLAEALSTRLQHRSNLFYLLNRLRVMNVLQSAQRSF